jgi:DNA-binding NtrC family response regulator
MIAEWVKGEIKLNQALREFERRYITMALKENSGNRSVAARKLGIHRNTLINKVKALNL